MEMEYRVFTVRLPVGLVESLDEESRRKFHKQNARNQMIVQILTDRYAAENEEGRDESEQSQRQAANGI